MDDFMLGPSDLPVALSRAVSQREQERAREEKERRRVAERDRERRDQIMKLLGPQGTLTGGSDIIWVAGSSLLWALLLRLQRANQNDVPWAILGGAFAGFLAMQLAGANQAATLRNVAFGVTSGSAAYLASRI